jgi:pyruvate kinase
MVTDESSVARQAGTLLRGVWASVLDAIDDVEAMFHHAVTIGKANGWIKDGDPVVYVYGPPVMRVLVV